MRFGQLSKEDPSSSVKEVQSQEAKDPSLSFKENLPKEVKKLNCS